MTVPGALLASGRDADIYEYGQGRVLRRSRKGRSLVNEARTMEYARSRGYPVPKVFDVTGNGCDLVMERVDGVTMVDMGAQRPWRVKSMGRELAELHELLHRLPAPDWLPSAPIGVGDRLLHMDLHPLNVIIGADGPMVIDWTNAARGESLVDVAVAWALIASGDVPSRGLQSLILGVGRRLFLNAFLKPFQGSELRSKLAEGVAWKSRDPNMTPSEVQRMRSLL